MANFAQLQCFNKLLLEKMERMEIEHKKEMDKLRSKYEIVKDICENCASDRLLFCDGCDYPFDPENYDCRSEEPYASNIVDYENDIYYCGKCADKCPYTKCNDCDEVTIKSLTCDGYDYCDYCFKRRQYEIYYDVNNIEEVFYDGHVYKNRCLYFIRKYKK